MKKAKKQVNIDGVAVELIRKKIKNLRLTVLPPDGKVRVSAPLFVSQGDIQTFVSDNVSWIEAQKRALESRPIAVMPQYISGESHPLWGQQKRLTILEGNCSEGVMCSGSNLTLYVRSASSTAKREKVLDGYYRRELQRVIPPLMEKYQASMNVEVDQWRIKKMKTRWGSCNISARRIWLNLALVKFPQECLEYVIVHELAHLFERYHNRRFWRLVEKHFPSWKEVRARLKEY